MKEKKKLQWHPAFYAALQIELREEKDLLYFENEHQLGTKPKEIDVLIIKKRKQEQIRKNIGRIFREHNIFEYKSPDDYLSINDFYKVWGYTCFYISDTERIGIVDPQEVTITFVGNQFPRKMCNHLREVHGIQVERRGPGIYYLRGTQFPVQILVTKELSEEENLWMSSLRGDLQGDKTWQRLLTEYQENRKNILYDSTLDVILRANQENEKEGKDDMCEALEEMIEAGRKETRIEIIRKFQNSGMELEKIAEILGYSREDLQELLGE